jgi:hypothetical protein
MRKLRRKPGAPIPPTYLVALRSRRQKIADEITVINERLHDALERLQKFPTGIRRRPPRS